MTLLSDVMDITVVAGVVSLIIMSLTLVVTWYVGMYLPPRGRPHVVDDADHYLMADDLAGHDYLLFNKARGAARDVGLRVSFEPQSLILGVRCDPPPHSQTGGKGHDFVELHWKELGPKNHIMARIMTRADKERLEAIYPLAYKAWHRGALIREERMPDLTEGLSSRSGA